VSPKGVPFAREYGGLLDNRFVRRRAGVAHLLRRGQTGQQLLLGAYQALMRRCTRRAGVRACSRAARCSTSGRHRRKGARHHRANLVTGEIERTSADAGILATGGLRHRLLPLDQRRQSRTLPASWRAHKRGASSPNPCFTQIHPTCIPGHGDHQSKLTLMSESLRNDGRVWVPKKKGDQRPPEQIPEDERDYYLERKYPSFGNLVPRDVASRNAKQAATRAAASARAAWRLSRFQRRHQAAGPDVIRRSTATSSRCTRRSPTRIRTRCRCGSTPPSITRWAACGWTTT
jgi:succinate dehydrogenase / fumarate reductase flavoprotein subunit